MARFALDVTARYQRKSPLSATMWRYVRSKTNTASIFLEIGVIETLLQGQCARPRLVLGAILIRKDGAFLLDKRSILGQFGIFGEGNATHYIGGRPNDLGWIWASGL